MKMFVSAGELREVGVEWDYGKSGLWLPELDDEVACLKAARFLSKIARYLRRFLKSEQQAAAEDASVSKATTEGHN